MARLFGALTAALVLGAPPTTAGNRLAAHQDAQRLLGRVVLPAGAQRPAKPPRGLPPLVFPGSPALVDDHEFWRVPDSVERVVAFERAHPPRGSKLFEWSPGESFYGLGFAYPELPGRLATRWVQMRIVAAHDGSTTIRVDAQVVWIVTRPRSEIVPSATNEIDVGAHHVTDLVKVRRIVRWFNALPIVQPGSVYHCEALVLGPKLRIDFRGASGLLARATFAADTMNHSLVSTPCTPISFSSPGQVKFPPLVGGDFLLRVQRLIGEKLL